MRAAFGAIAAPNFVHFIGPGASHGQMQDDGFYSIASNGLKLVDWVRDLLADRPMNRSVDCEPHC